MMKSAPDTNAHDAAGEQPPVNPLSRRHASLNPSFTANPTPCPCCQETSLESAFQESLIPNGQGYTLTHCKNQECDGYALTLKHETFLQQMTAIAQGDSDE